MVWCGRVIIVSALSLSLRDKDRLREREIEREREREIERSTKLTLPNKLNKIHFTNFTF